MPHEIIKSDGSTLENPIYKDLISNLTLFNQAYNPIRLADLEDFNDDSDYSTYPTLESVLEEYDPETYAGKTFTVRVAEEYIFSSDAELGGYDFDVTHRYVICPFHSSEYVGVRNIFLNTY